MRYRKTCDILSALYDTGHDAINELTGISLTSEEIKKVIAVLKINTILPKQHEYKTMEAC